jgi:hypothetical protein
MQMLEGSLDDEKFVAGWVGDGRLVAALGFSRPARITRYRAIIASGAGWPLDELAR